MQPQNPNNSSGGTQQPVQQPAPMATGSRMSGPWPKRSENTASTECLRCARLPSRSCGQGHRAGGTAPCQFDARGRLGEAGHRGRGEPGSQP